MASFDYRLNPLYTIKECSSCGALYTTDYCCSKGGLVDKIVRDPDETPNLSQRLPNCPNCGDPVDGLYCRPCAFVRKCLNEGWFTIHDENEILNTSESSNDDTNVELAEYINTPNWNRPTVYYDDDDDDEESSIPLKDIIISGLPPCVAVTPVLLTEEPVDSLIMEDEHLDTIPATESDEVIKSSVENLVQIPSESEGIPKKMCDVPFRDNSSPLDNSKDQFEGFSDSNDDSTSLDDDSLSIDDIDYVEASLRGAINSNPPPSSNFVTKSSSKFPNSFLEGTNTFDNSLTESKTFCFDLEENSCGSTTTRSDYSLPDYEAFYFDNDHIEEKSSGSTTTYSNISLSKYDSFIFDLSNDPFPPADWSDFYHEEFSDELAQFYLIGS
ncbi:hypothetical protein Tco_0560956 [Tanacetum coccineum]